MSEPGATAVEEAVYLMTVKSEHQGADNEMTRVACELDRGKGEGFQPFVLDERGSPFLNFLHSILLCQLAYLRMNVSEVGHELETVRGRMRATAQGFVLRELDAEFEMTMRRGLPSVEEVRFIEERCRDCPVSRNLVHVKRKDTRVRVVGT